MLTHTVTIAVDVSVDVTIDKSGYSRLRTNSNFCGYWLVIVDVTVTVTVYENSILALLTST